MLAGIMAFTGGSLAQKVVHVQLAPQKIGFAPAGSKLPADGYIQLHLKGIGKEARATRRSAVSSSGIPTTKRSRSSARACSWARR